MLRFEKWKKKNMMCLNLKKIEYSTDRILGKSHQSWVLEIDKHILFEL